MYTTTDERGILNNYAIEPLMSYAEYPTIEEQRQYFVQGAVATFVVAALTLVATSIH